MKNFLLNRDIARLAILQRIELADPFLKKIRKIFGRYLFSNFFSKYFVNIKVISNNYLKIMEAEYNNIEKFLVRGQRILSIGSGVGGLEVIINSKFDSCIFTFIERDFISKKIRYGWDNLNSEGYNSLKLLEKFLNMNNLSSQNFELIDYDKNYLPKKKYDLITSLYSLDYHYKFEIYEDYLRKSSNSNTTIIFDTIRPEYFEKIFEKVEVIKEDNDTLHKSKRVFCKTFK